MNNHAHHVSKSREQGVRDILALCKFVRTVERVALADACGRVAALDVKSKNTLPNALTSSMDAIAVRFADFEDSMPDTSNWIAGRDYAFCNTGVGIKGDFDTAIIVEDISFDEQGRLSIANPPKAKGQNTVAPGTSMREGDVLIERGWIYTPALIGLVAQGGHTSVPVIRKPRVGFIPSGNELVAAGEELPLGCSVECNSLMFAANVAAWGAKPIVHAICKDDWSQIRTAIEDMLPQVDILVVNAGSSKGTDDLTIEIIEEMGEVLNHEFDHGPGRHCSYSIVDGKPVVGIAGPPVGAEFCFEWYLKPVIDAFLGYAPENPPVVYARLDGDLSIGKRAVDVVRRVSLSREGGELWAFPLPMSEKPVLKMCAMADGLITVRKDEVGYAAGELVPVELRYPYRMP